MTPFPVLRAVATALPPHYADQDALTHAVRKLWKDAAPDRLGYLHRAAKVSGRYLALPVEEYERLASFSARNEAWFQVASELAERAAREALARASLDAGDVDHLLFTTVTGIATPTVDARLVNRLGMRGDVKRTPIFGLGCVAGASGIARAADYLRGAPDDVALLVSVELCSLTLQHRDRSMANVVASALFGDGAAAVVLAGGGRAERGARVLGSRASFYHDSERVMGWDVVDTGFKVVLSPDVPKIVHEHIGEDVRGFLGEHGLDTATIDHWIVHPGGPRVLEAVLSSLGLRHDALERSWRSLERVGNVSAASVLFVLADLLEGGAPTEGSYGLVLAMGPGFCSEQVLLRW